MISPSNLFISETFANNEIKSEITTQSTSPTPPAPPSTLTNFIPLIAIFVVFYFLLIRPQQKKIKEHQKTLTELKNGDKVCTNSGIFGVIKQLNKEDKTVELEIANNVQITILQQNISNVIKEKTYTNKHNKNIKTIEGKNTNSKNLKHK